MNFQLNVYSHTFIDFKQIGGIMIKTLFVNSDDLLQCEVLWIWGRSTHVRILKVSKFQSKRKLS